MNIIFRHSVLCLLVIISVLPLASCTSPTEVLKSAKATENGDESVDSEGATKDKPAAKIKQDPTNVASANGERTNPADALRHEDLDAILWLRTSGEYRAITRQAYHAAANSLGDALLDPDWTASTEQQQLADDGEIELDDLPPAVVMDVDETVLDNSDYQVQLIESGAEYSRDSWRDFCNSKSSRAVPGAVEFVARCRAAGVQVLFVTNREFEVEAATRENMIAVGLMNDSDADILFCKREKENWTSEKIARRTFLAEKYRLLMLFGDDLHDFTDLGHHPTSAARQEIVKRYDSWWGTRWIILPNPNYGGWEQSTYRYQYTSDPKTKLELKNEALQPTPAADSTADGVPIVD